MFDSKFVNRQYLRFMNLFQIHTSGAGEVPLGLSLGDCQIKQCHLLHRLPRKGRRTPPTYAVTATVGSIMPRRIRGLRLASTYNYRGGVLKTMQPKISDSRPAPNRRCSWSMLTGRTYATEVGNLYFCLGGLSYHSHTSTSSPSQTM